MNSKIIMELLVDGFYFFSDKELDEIITLVKRQKMDRESNKRKLSEAFKEAERKVVMKELRA